MNCARKPLLLLIATLAPFLSGTLRAAGFGELVVHSSLGEPLRAEVGLVRAPGEAIDADCFKAMMGAGDDIPWIHHARIRLVNDRLLLSTREPVNHPVAMLGLRIACGSELRKEFTLLLSPPTIRDAGRPVDLPIGAPPGYPDLPSAPAATAAAGQGGAPAKVAPQRVPRVRAAASAQPLPTSAPPTHRQAFAATADAPVARAVTPRLPAPVLQQDRLLIGAGDEAALIPLRMSVQLANPPKSDDAAAQRPLNQEQRTLAEIDDRIAAQIELDEKIKRLEEYQALLKERVAQLDLRQPAASPAVAASSAPTTSHPATEERAETLLAQWAAPLGGLLAVLVGGGALIYLRRRRHNTADSPVTTEAEFHTTLQHPGPFADTESSGLKPPAAKTTTTAMGGKSALPEMRKPVVSTGTSPSADTASAEWAEPTFAPAHPIPFDETVDEHDSALELAEIMMSFGRTQGAAETLADYIRNNPRQAVKPWLKLLEVYHVAGMRAEFEALTRQLNKTFNVKMIGWGDFKVVVNGAAETVEQMPHVVQRLQELWGTQEAQAYIHQILRDNRNGTRQGFPLTVVEELLLLLAILDDELGAYKPPVELSLVDMDPPEEGRADPAAA
ncbi:MAG: hypothetical protein J0L98_08015 [Zoogloea sp.]|nr:hypothetical protein [Zoogloea sp.]